MQAISFVPVEGENTLTHSKCDVGRGKDMSTSKGKEKFEPE